MTTVLTYDGWRPIAEWDGNGNLVATNVYGIGIDEILFTANAQGQFYYKSDALGNVRFLLNSSSTRADRLIEQYTYDAFGAPTIKDGNGNVIPASAVGNRFMYKGREYLATLGVYDNRRRIYHPGLGKFLQVDPIRFGGSETANLYRFMGHNPLGGSDAMGEDYPGGSLSDSSPFLYGIDPYAFSEPSLFSDFGALDAPIADVNKIINAEPGDATIAASGTAVTQLGNMALDQGSMPGPAGDGLQSGNDSPAAQAQVYGVGTGLSAALPTLDSGWYPASRDAYHAIFVELSDGSESMPVTEVKNTAQEGLFHVPVGSCVPYVMPDTKDPQSISDHWSQEGKNWLAFKAYWQPKSWGGENDWKRPPGNATYDAAANFMLGESGTVAGFSENELLFWTNLVKGFNNNPINVMDIQAGIATGALVQHLGAGVTVVPVNFP